MEPKARRGSKWPRRGQLIWFGLVVGLSLFLQLALELFSKGLGSGVAPAMLGLSLAPTLALASMVLVFGGLVWSGFWRAVRAAGYAAALHVLMTGHVWLTISTPMHEWSGRANGWLDDHPQTAGAWTFAAGVALLLALRLTSVHATTGRWRLLKAPSAPNRTSNAA